MKCPWRVGFLSLARASITMQGPSRRGSSMHRSGGTQRGSEWTYNEPQLCAGIASSVRQVVMGERGRRVLGPRENASQELYYNPGGQGSGQHDRSLGKSMSL